jgi:putative hemolysin
MSGRSFQASSGLADRPTREVMTPRTDVDWIDIDSSDEDVRRQLVETPHTRLPVAQGSVDQLLGVVQARDIAAALAEGRALDLRALLRKRRSLGDQMDAMDTLAVLPLGRRADGVRARRIRHFDGLVTPADLLAALAGAFVSDRDTDTDPPLVEREDGSWLVSGSLSADALSDRLGINLHDDRDYATVAGFALSVLKHLPEVGEVFRHDGWRWEVVDMDGRKIDKLLASVIVRDSREEG